MLNVARTRTERMRDALHFGDRCMTGRRDRALGASREALASSQAREPVRTTEGREATSSMERTMSKRASIGSLFVLLSTGPLLAAQAPETDRSIEGVRAVEAHWQRAFLSGDEAYLDTLLDAAYVSVGHAGNARPKAEIIALSKKVAEKKMTPQPPEHPATIVVRDNAAVVTDSGSGDTSVDVFYYAGGRWHAWYSQHTPVTAPK